MQCCLNWKWMESPSKFGNFSQYKYKCSQQQQQDLVCSDHFIEDNMVYLCTVNRAQCMASIDMCRVYSNNKQDRKMCI